MTFKAQNKSYKHALNNLGDTQTCRTLQMVIYRENPSETERQIIRDIIPFFGITQYFTDFASSKINIIFTKLILYLNYNHLRWILFNQHELQYF